MSNNWTGLLGGIFSCLFTIVIECSLESSGDPNQTPRYVASDLVLHCLHTSHKKDARLTTYMQVMFVNKEPSCFMSVVINAHMRSNGAKLWTRI